MGRNCLALARRPDAGINGLKLCREAQATIAFPFFKDEDQTAVWRESAFLLRQDGLPAHFRVNFGLKTVF